MNSSTATRKQQQPQSQRAQMQEPMEYTNTTSRLRDDARKPGDSTSRVKQTAPPRPPPPRYSLQQQQQQQPPQPPQPPQQQQQQPQQQDRAGRQEQSRRQHDFVHRDVVEAPVVVTTTHDDRRESSIAPVDEPPFQAQAQAQDYQQYQRRSRYEQHGYHPHHPLSHMRDIVLPEPLAHNTHSYMRRERFDDDGCSSTSSGSTSTIGFDDDDHHLHRHHHYSQQELPLFDQLHRPRDLKDVVRRHQHHQHHQHQHQHQHQHHQHRHHYPSPSSLSSLSSFTDSNSNRERDRDIAVTHISVPDSANDGSTVCLSCSGCDRCRPRLVRHQDLGHAFEIELYIPETFGSAIKVEAEPRQVEITADREVKLAGERRTFNFTERIKFGADVDEHAVAAVMNPATRCLTVTCPKML